MITIEVKDLKTTWLWLMAVDWGDGKVYLTYKAGGEFVKSEIHLN